MTWQNAFRFEARQKKGEYDSSEKRCRVRDEEGVRDHMKVVGGEDNAFRF